MDPTASKTIPALVRAAAERFRTATAIEDGPLRMSFAELVGAVTEAARALAAIGVAPGDRVAVWAPNLHEWIVAAIGAQSAGAALVPLNTRFKGSEAGYVLRKSRARVLVTMSEFLGTRYADMLQGALGGADAERPVAELPDLENIVLLPPTQESKQAPATEGVGILSWQALLARAAETSESEIDRRVEALGADDMSDILFTSGTTGKPKGVVTCHGQNIRAFATWSEVVGLREGDRYLVVNPFFHAFGYKAGWLSALMCGATVLPHAVFDAPAVLERIGKDRVSMLPGPPALYQTILAHPDRDKHDLSTLRLAVTGAAAIPVELIHRMRDELGFETVITGYGLTECCGVVTMCRYDDDPETIAATSGRAISNVEVRCVDPAGNEVARGEPGEVVVRGYNVMQGYFEDPAATAQTIDAEGWLHTGDVGVMDQRGYLRITDRIKDMFIMGGFNCYPAEIENLMLANTELAQVAVIGIPDERMGEVGMAFVVPVPGRRPSRDEIVAWCREHMANYKVPRHVRVVDELPMNASGKVMKYVLREQLGN